MRFSDDDGIAITLKFQNEEEAERVAAIVRVHGSEWNKALEDDDDAL